MLAGTAWLSSVRVVKCNIKLFNERNPCRKYSSTYVVKDTVENPFSVGLTLQVGPYVTTGQVHNLQQFSTDSNERLFHFDYFRTNQMANSQLRYSVAVYSCNLVEANWPSGS